MPNRIIKESICTSQKINSLSDFNFRLWVCLLTYVDDYGRGKAHPAIIRGNCLPLRERVTTKDVENGLHVLADIGCISLYTVDGESYLCFPNWDKHQTIRNKKSNFPAPPTADSKLKSIEINCNQLQSIASNCVSNPIQSNPIQKEEEEEEEEDNNARAREIAEEWQASFGDKPTPALIRRIDTAASGMEEEAIRRAIRLSAVRSDKNPKSYLMSLLQDWQSKKLKTADDVDEYLLLSDTAKGSTGIGNAEQARQDLGEFLNRKKTDTQQLDRMFEKVWTLYPLKHSRAKAYEQFVKLNPDVNTLTEIINAITRQRKTGPWLEGKMETLASWLRLERWKDTEEDDA